MLTKIIKFNRLQILRAIWAGICSVLGTLAAFGFFYMSSHQVWRFFSEPAPVPKAACLTIALLAVVLLFIEGLRRARAGKGLYSFLDSPGHLGLDWSSGGAVMVEMEVASRITGPAYILTQLFLCGPLQWQKMHDSISSIFPATEATSGELEQLLSDLEMQRGWQSLRKFDERQAVLKKLIDMELVDFSPRTKSIRLIQPALDNGD
jgi:hypothetical protein